MRRVRRVAKRQDAAVGILADLQGPKIRVGKLKDAEPIYLKRGMTVVIDCKPGVIGCAQPDGSAEIGTGYRRLAKDVSKGERILLDDGNLEIKVIKVVGERIETQVIHGGLLIQSKGINLPGTKVSAGCLSKKDLADLKVALDAQVDFVALSFVREASDVEELRRHIKRQKGDASIIAKIERPEAVKNLTSILAATDAVMVARGDMGVEMGPEVVPQVQKRIIELCNQVRKPVITATQMLETMIANPRPTRAEASDVANAIYDGTSAVMLSGETASGKYPVRTVRTMEKIVRSAERQAYVEMGGPPPATLGTHYADRGDRAGGRLRRLQHRRAADRLLHGDRSHGDAAGGRAAADAYRRIHPVTPDRAADGAGLGGHSAEDPPGPDQPCADLGWGPDHA